MVKDPKDIPWELIVPELVKTFTPIIQGVTWLAISKVDKKANALNNLIAIAEIIPAIDLGLPRGIVLAAMYDKTGDALEMINQLVQAIEDLPGDLKKFIQDQIDETKKDIEETFIDPVTEASHDFQTALKDCRDNAQSYLGTGLRYRSLGGLWIVSCMGQKGFSISADYIKDKLF